MIDERCIGPGVDRERISPRAAVSGASFLTGSLTSIGPGAVVRDCRLHDAVVEADAEVLDSVLAAEGRPRSHRCDAAGRVVVSGDAPRVAGGAHVRGCTLINCSVGGRTQAENTWARDCRFGSDCSVKEAKLVLAEVKDNAVIRGPTEISEARLGHHARIDARGYYEGVFSNVFRKLRFDESSKRLKVAETVDLPHVSRYGTNTINSTNSGKVRPMSEPLSGFGPPEGLWKDRLLSHEQIELAPCCWVVPWTKVIGQSARPHRTDEELVNDELTTYLMPFAMAGLGGQSTQGLVMPGEMSTGFGPKQRKGAWVFTYAPDAVIRMVRRLFEALEPERKDVADGLVVEAIRTAMEMTRAMAARHAVDLSVPPSGQRRGWPKWIAKTFSLLSAHLDGGLWEFSRGEPVGWRLDSGKWTHPGMDGVLRLAPDAVEEQVNEDDLFSCEDPLPRAAVAVPAGEVGGTGADADVHADARVSPDATIAPGCRIGALSVVEAGAFVWNSVIDECVIRSGASVERSVLRKTEIGRAARVRSCRMAESRIGAASVADAASARESHLAPDTVISAFADLVKVECVRPTILGGAVRSAEIGVYFMSMHMAGGADHLKAVPVRVELDGEKVDVPAIPMVGGGCIIRGAEGRPVELACSFIGSNAVLEPNTRVGFGCFVLGTLGPDAGLPPFTLCPGGGVRRHQIGAVLTSMPSTVITHFVNWTYQALGEDGAPAVAAMVRQSIEEGVRAVEAELGRRREAAVGPAAEPPRYGSLRDYDEAQLLAGLEHYGRALDSGAWEMEFEDGELRFSSAKGRWVERGGAVLWRKEEPGPGR